MDGVRLDVKDKRILGLLARNARLPISAIAKRVALSRDTVSYRIRNMEKNGLIQGYKTTIDIKKFGYDAYHIFLQLTPFAKEEEEKLIATFVNYASARAVLKFSGRFDYELAVVAANIEEFDKILGKILIDCGTHLQNYEVLIITKHYLSQVFPKSCVKIQNEIRKNRIVKYKPDEKDVAILEVIASDATLPLHVVAGQVGLSADAVNYRIKKLIAAGIILKFVPAINYAALSYGVYTVLASIPDLDRNESSLRQFLNTDENILWAVKAIGKYNVLIYVCAKNTMDLHETIIGLRSRLPNTKDYEILVLFDEYKYRLFPEVLTGKHF